ncbi:MAG: CaiB/BaiF CoA-transferase family protein [Smithellaceae bacterium]|nr:CaiB/BaiF CoA-transferase family protein [Smithellaceae bacterium]
MPGPIHGLKVLDFTSLLPGPYATMNLADLGAEVLRVTSRSRPDLVAFFPPFLEDSDLSAGMAYLGRGKRCLPLNLKDPRAPEVIKRLLPRYDILIEQFRPGVMVRLGLDYETLRAVNPGLIYLSLTGYGQSGPQSLRAGHDINYLARSGLMAYSGRKDTGPTLTGMQIADLAAGAMQSIVGILAAVIHRQRTGEGQYVDVSMLDGMIAFQALSGTAFLCSGEEPGREATFLNGGSLYDFYETADGEFMSFGGLEPQFFAAFCRALGREDLIAGGVAPPDGERVKAEIRVIIKTRSRADWERIFADWDACVEPVLSLGEALDNAQTRAREMVVEIDLPGGKTVRQLANPLKFSRTPPAYGRAGAALESHHREVLLAAGFSPEEISDWEKTGLFK